MKSMQTAMKRRTYEEIQQHYLIEKELAQRLKGANKEERRSLYADLYNELFTRVPTHPQNLNITSPEKQRELVMKQFRDLKDLITRDTVYLEIGAGDCALALHIAQFAKKVYAVDVAETIAQQTTTPTNFSLIISDGVSIPVSEPVDLVYSNQLMEHLHPDDAEEQLRNIFASMRQGAKYFCITPNRLTGPHDVSQFFEDVATGFHLKEYTYTELNQLFRKIGFTRLHYYRKVKGIAVQFDSRLLAWSEQFINLLPKFIRNPLVKFAPVKAMFNSIHLIGVK